VIQSHLNRAAGRHGLMFGPDTASATRATLGGMLGNNSSGSRSILFGKTVDHVRRVEAVLSDGAVHRLGPGDLPALAAAHAGRGVLGAVLELAGRIRSQEAEEIRARFPAIMGRVSGYNLDALLEPDPVNLASLLVGSEGSLGTVLEMEVDLVPAPAQRGVGLLHFADLEPAIEATVPVLALGPAAVELMDDMLLDLAAEHPSFRRRLWFMTPRTRAVQLVEFFADSPAELAGKLRALEALGRGLPGSVGVTLAETALQIDDAWAVRKAGLPLLASIPTRRKPLPFVEDTAVSPERLPAFASASRRS
jgi:FAD/FMN-containing dehydrogenase